MLVDVVTAMALHAIGTVVLGGGIFLAGQIFNLQEHWPGGILLWAIGAVLSWLVLRDWLQATLSALLVPAWIASEWSVRARPYSGVDRILFQFLAVLAITYLSALRGGRSRIFGGRWFGREELRSFLCAPSSLPASANFSGIGRCRSFHFLCMRWDF